MRQVAPHALGAEHWSAPVAAPLKKEAGSAVVFEHHGPMDHSVVETLLAKAEEASIAARDAVALRKRLFNVLVEGLDNMRLHAGEDHRESAFAVLVDTPAGYRLLMGNALPVATAALLTHRVGILNEMDEADLREHYMRLLSNDSRTERGGAGLGLLTMARKSARPMVARTLPRDGGSAYFALELAVLRA